MAYTFSDRQPTDEEVRKATWSCRRFDQAVTVRNNYAAQWEEVAALLLPHQRNTFMVGSFTSPGTKMTDQQVDASGMMALHRFGAICDSLLTPRNATWHALQADDDYVMKDRATRLWFEDTTRRLFRYRYTPSANFSSQNQNNYIQLGAYGTMGMFVDRLYSQIGEVGLRYRSLPIGEIFIFENHQGQVDEIIRYFKLTPDQIYKQWPDNFPATLRAALEGGSQEKYEILHHIYPRDGYDPDRMDNLGMPWGSCYVVYQSKTLLSESGYRMFPTAISRYAQAPSDVYGIGPGMLVLPSLKTLNAQKRTFLKQGHRAADPILLTADDGVIPNMRPGAVNPGGMSPDGRPLIGVLPTGNIQTNEEMMAREAGIINDAFLVSLFQILEETPRMSATEVLERINEKGILIAPTMGRQQSEYLGSMIPREIDLLSADGLLAPMPPRLREARGSYSIVYTSPLSRMARSQESVGFMRTVESVKEIVSITGDPAPLDRLDFDAAVAGIAEQQSVPELWLASDDTVRGKREARAASARTQTQIQAAPAAAAMMKAKAAAGLPVGPEQGPDAQVVQ